MLDPQGPVTLYVGNESRVINPVDIRVEIDGHVVAQGLFGHGPYEPPYHEDFQLALDPGDHQVKVSSVFGRASLTEQFKTSGRRQWAAVWYWYTPDQTPMPRSITFDLSDEPFHYK